ncbi:MAG: class I SAM-dependent methyltransferase [Bacteroidetes bacterium]|nr:class I SAM-dependent methyltransferase [Bacteroidota bacterium]
MDLSKIEKLYSGNIEKFGIDSRSVGWKDAGSQSLRFQKLMNVVSEKNVPFTINELGCGYGELYKFLLAENFSVNKFSGYDISDEMLKSARNYLGEDEKVKLIKGPQLEQEADYSTTSGIFNVMFDARKEDWEDYIKETLLNMNRFSTKGFSFNLLTSYVDFKAADLYYADPAIFFDFCKRECSKQVALLHDYPLYEWTIIVRK